VILATGAGWALQTFAAVPNALVFGLIVGLIGARLVPATASCGVPRKP
jgi:hypothetical protein